MINVLLVDDEKLALNYIEHLVAWQDFGFNVIGTASDGERAIFLYRKYKPELIITDVNMPGMSGIDMSMIIRESDKNVHILFLSGYKEFNYIKQALRLGIDDYILKSDLDEAFLTTKLLAIREQIEKEALARSFTFNKIVEDIFIKNVRDESYRDIVDSATYIRILKSYYYILVDQMRPMEFISQYLPDIGIGIMFDEDMLKSICKNDLNDANVSCETIFQINKSQYAVVISIKRPTVSQQEIYQTVYNYGTRLYDLMNINGAVYNVYFSSLNITVRKFRTYYFENSNNLSIKYISGKPICGELDKCGVLKGKTENDNVINYNDLVKALREGEQEIFRELWTLMSTFVNERDIISFTWWCRKLFGLLYSYNNQVGKTSGRLFLLQTSHANYNFFNPSGLIEFLSYKTEELISIINEEKEKEYSKPVGKMLQYIQKHYSSPDITVNSIAGFADLSPTWAALKFKEEVGINLNEYLNEFRIKKAMELFDHGDYMIYEVSEKTGFTSSQYFSKVFHKFTGSTPNQYRNRGQ